MSAPGQVETGTGGSIYVGDRRGIEHYSKTGQMLAKIPVKNETFAVDATGGIYVLAGDRIERVSGSGNVMSSFRAPKYEPATVLSNGDLLAVYGGQSYAMDQAGTVATFSPTGKLIRTWKSYWAYFLVSASADRLFALGGRNTDSDVALIDPSNGKVISKFPRSLGPGYDALAIGPQGTIFVGRTVGGDTPFTVQRVTKTGGRYSFATINQDAESISQLTVNQAGDIFVVRAGYNEPGSNDTGLYELSPSGASMGEFAFCKH